ncbi:hypothetical protein [Rhizobium sp.]|uniref:hypothetical protein n=1 Tax=Rhizobium sp. TaxID=391 RepID=UPI0034C5B471
MTRIRQIIRLMTELGLGYDRTAVPTPAHTTYLPVSGSTAGRIVPFGVPDVDEDNYADLPSLPFMWVPVEEPTPSRWYPARTKGHSRGTVVHPMMNKAITYSSTYEMNILYMLSACRDVVKIDDQPASIYVSGGGGEYRHTIDYRATLASGYRIAIAVRPTWLIEKDDLHETVERINAGSLRNFADEAVLLTEREITNDRGWNAKAILHYLRTDDEFTVSRLLDIASRISGTVSIYDLIRGFDQPALAWTAVFKLIYRGVLVPAHPDRKIVDKPFVSFNPLAIH